MKAISKKKLKKQLQKKAHSLWVKACVKMWGDKDEISGGKIHTIHHFIPRARCLALRYDPMNGVPISLKNHFLIHFGHNPPEVHELVDKIEKGRKELWLAYIDRHKREFRRNNIAFLEGEITKLEGYLAE